MKYLISESQIEKWRGRNEKRLADTGHVKHYRVLDNKRRTVQKQMLAFYTDFESGKTDLPTFKTDYDKKTRTVWDVFGLKGMSGAMFLNMLVKNIPDQKKVEQLLKQTIPLPTSEQQGRKLMQKFFNYFEGLIEQSELTKKQLQPIRTSYFIGSWWHLQNTELWPIYFVTARRVLGQDGLFQTSADPVADYFNFRAIYLELMAKLDLTAWDLEHLFAWQDDQSPEPLTIGSSFRSKKKGKGKQTKIEKKLDAEAEEIDEVEKIEEVEEKSGHNHSQIQWILANIGRELGCKVWVASNDHNRMWDGKKLGTLSENELPTLGLDRETHNVIKLIDVIWLEGKRVVAAFEVEKSTSVYSGILRMSDLVASAPNLSIPLYIVAPEVRMAKVHRELSRPTFQSLSLHEQCGFFSFETLIENEESIIRWSESHKAINKLAKWVDSV
jgi:hypothetical protein